MIRKLVLLFLLVLNVFNAQAQEQAPMADVFRAEGKIYVVVTVIAMIFVALLVFLVYIERKLKKLEEKIK